MHFLTMSDVKVPPVVAFTQKGMGLEDTRPGSRDTAMRWAGGSKGQCRIVGLFVCRATVLLTFIL